jgi:hypothetical protein
MRNIRTSQFNPVIGHGPNKLLLFFFSPGSSLLQSPISTITMAHTWNCGVPRPFIEIGTIGLSDLATPHGEIQYCPSDSSLLKGYPLFFVPHVCPPASRGEETSKQE